MDFNMPRLNGIAATQAIHSRLPHIKIIGLSMYDEAEQKKAMLDAGASAYVTKCGEFDKLVHIIPLICKSRPAGRPIIDISADSQNTGIRSQTASASDQPWIAS